MSVPPNMREYWSKLQRIAQPGGGGGGGPGGAPKNFITGAGGLFLLGGVYLVGTNALFNVDGGHRAIKYTRVGGVRQEIYSEGILPITLYDNK